MVSSTRRELEALRSEVEALRAERRHALADDASQYGVDASANDVESGSGSLLATDWNELRQLAQEIAEEVGQISRDHPALGIGGAFILGLLAGRVLMR